MRIRTLFLLTLIIGPLWVLFTHQVNFSLNWKDADRSSAGLAPNASIYKPAVVQVYAARVYHVRGLVAVHTWIATKSKNAKSYTVYQVIGWRSYWGKPVYTEDNDVPDRVWFSNHPWLLKDIRGIAAEKLIEKIRSAAEQYPYKNTYHYWPGPNSNTFIAFIARAVPELELALPPTAIGKDYLGDKFFAKAPSATGYQFSLFGVIGVLVALDEGVEINFLGLVWGIDFEHPAIILPGVGRVGL